MNKKIHRQILDRNPNKDRQRETETERDKNNTI